MSQKSLHERFGRNALPIVQNMMKDNVTTLERFDVVDEGNHYTIKKDGKEMRVPLCHASCTFEALKLFVDK